VATLQLLGATGPVTGSSVLLRTERAAVPIDAVVVTTRFEVVRLD
jgi:hypothetical protein